MNTAKQQIKLEELTHKWLESYQACGKKIFCKKGCSGCCSLAVHATFPEAQNVARELTTELTSRLHRYINGLKGYVPELTDLKSYLKLHRQQIGPCPFLDEHGSCSIYNLRPLSCRSLLSTRPADWCTVDFSSLDEWDKLAYENGLDKTVVAWPTHFVAATQDYARQLETEILQEMDSQYGWRLTGNFPLMVWLADQYREETSASSAESLRKTLMNSGLDSELLATFNNETAGL
jgi:Fe-S-cluster containining protein